MNIFLIMILISDFGADVDSFWVSLNRITPNVGFSAVKVDMDAKSAGMGNITNPDISTSPLENPALTPKNVKFNLFHRSHLLGTSFNQGSFYFNKNRNFFSLSLWDFGSEGMELHTDTPGESEITYNAYNFIVATTYARKFPNYSAGISFKILNEKILNASYSVPAFDFGVIYKTQNNISLSFSFLNLGPDYLNTMRLPKTIKFGIYFGNKKFKTGLEGVKSIDSKIQLRTGLNYDFDILSLRAGGILNSDSEMFSAGIGLHLTRFDFDYAVIPFRNALGITQIFNISLK